MKYYEMGGYYRRGLHPLISYKSKKQDDRIRWKMSGEHDSLYGYG